MEFNNAHKDNRFDIPEDENVDLSQSPVTAKEMEDAVRQLEQQIAGTDIEGTYIPHKEEDMGVEEPARIPEPIPISRAEQDSQEIRRLVEELSGAENLVDDAVNNPPPPRWNGGGGGDSNGGGGRGVVYESAGNPVDKIVFETSKKFKECVKCGGSGRRFLLFSCGKCRGTGRVVTEEKTKDTRVKGSLRKS